MTALIARWRRRKGDQTSRTREELLGGVAFLVRSRHSLGALDAFPVLQMFGSQVEGKGNARKEESALLVTRRSISLGSDRSRALFQLTGSFDICTEALSCSTKFCRKRLASSLGSGRSCSHPSCRASNERYIYEGERRGKAERSAPGVAAGSGGGGSASLQANPGSLLPGSLSAGQRTKVTAGGRQ